MTNITVTTTVHRNQLHVPVDLFAEAEAMALAQRVTKRIRTPFPSDFQATAMTAEAAVPVQEPTPAKALATRVEEQEYEPQSWVMPTPARAKRPADF
jgi:hypothetical protein